MIALGYYKYKHMFGSLDGSVFLQHKWIWTTKSEYKKRKPGGPPLTFAKLIYIRTDIKEGYIEIGDEEYKHRFFADYNTMT